MIELQSFSFAGVRQTPPGDIPESLVSALTHVEQHARSKKRIAVFDLDNTLLVGDIGEAVFVKLKLQGYVPEYRWEDYRRTLKANRQEAYAGLVRAMGGLTERIVQRATLELLSRGERYLELDRSFIPVPYPHPLMQHLVIRLRDSGYRVYVISASNEISARLVVWKMFGIPPFNVFAIRQHSQSGVLTDQLVEPIPIDEGKVEVFRKYIGETNPLITAGDSYLDIPLLRLTDPAGLTIWVGEEKMGYEAVRQRVAAGQRFFFMQRSPQSQFNENSPHG
jgi:phosphoserine phosphatase